MRRLILLLLFCASIAPAQVKTGSTKAGSVSIGGELSAGGNNAQSDFNARCSAPGVIRCTPIAGVAHNSNNQAPWDAYGINPYNAPNIGGTGGFFDNLSGQSGQNDGVTSGVPDSSVFTVNGGSTRFYEPGYNGSANGGNVVLESSPTSSTIFYQGSPSGNEFYVQFRQRIDQNMLQMPGGDDALEGRKDWLQTAADVYIDSNNFVSNSNCNAFQWVGGDFKQLQAPVFYLGGTCDSNAYDTGQENVYPFRTTNIYENGIGCTRDKTTTNQSQSSGIVLTRVSNVVTVALGSAKGSLWIAGNKIFIIGANTPDPTVNTNVTFNGVWPISAVIDSTHVQFLQQGPNQTVSNSGINVSIIDYSHCFHYVPNEWMTYMYHFILGTSYIGLSHNYHRDSTVEVYAAHEGQPYQLVTTVNDIDLVLEEDGSVASSARSNIAPYSGSVTPATAWWANQGVTPGDFRLNVLQFWNYRCSQATITAVSRDAVNGVAKFTYGVPFPNNNSPNTWNMGVGNMCPVLGDKIAVTNVPNTVDPVGGVSSFNGTYTICGSGTTGCQNPSGAVLYAVDPGNAVGNTSTTGTVEDYRYDRNCLGGPCDVHKWVTEFVESTKFISNPKVCSGATGCGGISNVITVVAPDPADHLLLTGLDGSGHPQLSWRCNDTNATYKVLRVTGDRYTADYNQSTGGGWITATNVGTASACVSQFGTQTFTDATTAANTQYSYVVVAHNSNGDSTRSAAVENTPGIPSDVQAHAIGPGNQTVSWVLQQPRIETAITVQRCPGVALTGSCAIAGAGWISISSGTCSSASPAGTTSCTDGDSLTPSSTYVYRVQSANSSGTTQSSGVQTVPSNTTWGGNNGAAQITATSVSFPGLPSATGWSALGTIGYSGGDYMDTSLLSSPADPTTGSANQCPPNGYVNTNTQGSAVAQNYPLKTACGFLINAQSSGVGDTFNNFFYLWGGGHDDYSGNEMFKLDLTANPVTLRRNKNPTTPLECGNGGAHACSIGGDSYYLQSGGPPAVNAVPPDQTSTSFAISAISCSDATHATITLATPAPLFVTNTGTNLQWRKGKGFAFISSVVTSTGFNSTAGSAQKITTVTDSTHIIVSRSGCTGSGTFAADTTGTVAYTWSTCVADPTTGLGCSPNAIHSTQSLAYLTNGSDHTKDQFFKYGGSAASGPGDSTMNDAWTIALNGGIQDSTPWVANHMITGTYTGIASTSSSFENYCDFDTTSLLVYCLDRGDGKLYAYDYYGTNGPKNTWYTVSSSFNTNTQSSAIVWHNAGDTQRLFLNLPGCTQVQVTGTVGDGTHVTYTLSGQPASGLNYGSSNGRWVGFYNTGGFDTENVTSFTASNTGPTVQITDTRTGTGTTGFGAWCEATSAGAGQNTLAIGVFEADVTNGTTTIPANTRNDWTTATFALDNVDLGTAGYNTCAEAFSGGHFTDSTHGPLNGTKDGTLHYQGNGGISPGLTLFTGATGTDYNNGDIVIWPNQGTDTYDVQIDLVGDGTLGPRLQCKKISNSSNGHGSCASAPLNSDAPCNTSNNSGAGSPSTWGTWHRFDYYQQWNGFLMINAPDQPARILRPH